MSFFIASPAVHLLSFISYLNRTRRSRRMKPSVPTADTFLGFFSSVRRSFSHLLFTKTLDGIHAEKLSYMQRLINLWVVSVARTQKDIVCKL